jgi:hypothetical protein
VADGSAVGQADGNAVGVGGDQNVVAARNPQPSLNELNRA